MGEPTLDRERLRDCSCVESWDDLGAAGVDDDLLRLFRGRSSLPSAICSATEAEVLAIRSAWDAMQDDESRLRPRAGVMLQW